jgi:hypothetical protein
MVETPFKIPGLGLKTTCFMFPIKLLGPPGGVRAIPLRRHCEVRRQVALVVLAFWCLPTRRLIP